ncbi:glutamate receptor 2.5-like [Magnolia sinica]|uniref:glutamate receptor 2.5-like n=1 Tax=Magnolia sinica TaxID=86752 RepID=UPI00265B1871|nr:glutamate receptor 2.5-like [Magnolia sinica]
MINEPLHFGLFKIVGCVLAKVKRKRRKSRKRGHMPQPLSPLHHLLLLALMGGYWAIPTGAETLRIGVPATSAYPKFVKVKCNWTSDERCFSGHSIKVFRLVWENLHNNLSYKFIPYYGDYDSLIQQVYLKKFDAVIGDTSIVAKRCQYVEFSRPYTELGARMVVLEKQEEGKAWIFVKPFTTKLWALTGAIFFYNGLIVWLIESADDEEEISFCDRFGNLIWLSFTTLFPIHGEKLRSNLSKMAMVVWLFVALVLTQSYTASLTSMLTVRRLRPSVVDVESLLKGKARVGCDVGSFMSKYLEEVVGFSAGCVDTYNSDQYAQALSSGAIKAAFLEIPSIQLFLDENPKGFALTGPTYEIGGYAFVFPKGSHLVEEVSDEILRLRENGTLRKLEENLLSSHKRLSMDPEDDDENGRLSPDGFWGLFVVTGGMSTLALLLFLINRLRKNWQCKCYPQIQSVGQRVGKILGPRKIHNNDDHGPHSEVIELPHFTRCNTV